ncbi:MAG: hypothetical protein GY711_33285 [bacterium]|nr:hypothetical protein [bacterium]
MARSYRTHAFVAGALISAPAAVAQTNLALTGTATQSSLGFGGVPERAIDGNTDGTYNNGSVTHTADLSDSWWEVDLGGTFSIGEVRLYNRLDCCWLRLSNFRVAVFDGTNEVFGEDYFTAGGSVAQGGTLSVYPPGGVSGNRIQIRILGINNDSNGFLSLAEVEVYDGLVGTAYCGPAFPNSAGLAATITAHGTAVAGGNPLSLRASDVPSDQFGIFMASQTQGFTNPVGSTGILCLGGTMALFSAPGQIQNSGAAGSFELDIDTQAIPMSPPVPIAAGETWYFQAWYRDRNPTVTSNFTDGVSIVFQ